jgi:hypothetical protein
MHCDFSLEMVDELYEGKNRVLGCEGGCPLGGVLVKRGVFLTCNFISSTCYSYCLM